MSRSTRAIMLLGLLVATIILIMGIIATTLGIKVQPGNEILYFCLQGGSLIFISGTAIQQIVFNEREQ